MLITGGRGFLGHHVGIASEAEDWELFAPPYKPLMVDIGTAHGKVQALAVVANRASEHICPDLTLVQQARFIGTGAGFPGTSAQGIARGRPAQIARLPRQLTDQSR